MKQSPVRGADLHSVAQDSSSDLQLILVLNVLLVVVGGFIKWTVVDHGAALGPLGLWPNIYDVRFFLLCSCSWYCVLFNQSGATARAFHAPFPAGPCRASAA